MMEVTLSQHQTGKYIAHIFLDGQDHYGEGPTPGKALVELGFYLESMKKPDPFLQMLKETFS